MSEKLTDGLHLEFGISVNPILTIFYVKNRTLI
jgi:hypothetical protein